MAADPFYVNASQLVIEGVDPLLVLNNAVGTMEDGSIIQESDSGLVTVIERLPRRRRSWRISWGYLYSETMETLFMTNGRKYPFLFIPPRERHYKLSGHYFADGDGTTTDFQLTRGDLINDADDNNIRAVINELHYPIDDDFLEIRVNDVAVAFTLGTLGVVSLYNAPANGAILTVYCNFATPVRFSSETIDITMQNTDIDEIRSASIVEDFE